MSMDPNPPGPPDFPWRGCAANFPMPLNLEEELGAQYLAEQIYNVNCRQRNPPLDDIVYRQGYCYDCDVIRSVFRWDRTPYQEIFERGFRRNFVDDDSAYDLYDYVHSAGAPASSDTPRRYPFVSTTINRSWHPDPDLQTLPCGGEIQIYRYEIYAPGGIWVHLTLGDLYRFSSQAEVCFVGGIAPQYIRSAQLFTLRRPTYETGQRPPRATSRRADDRLIINGHFNPLLHPDENLRIQEPVFYFYDENHRRIILRHEIYTPPTRREKRQVSSDDNMDSTLKWYANDVADVPSYINAAFRATSRNEAYIFMKNEYVLVDYAPGTTNDRIVNGPLLICDGFHSLIDTPFGEHGIDCAFDTDNYNKAFIFSANLCAYIDYAPGTTDDKILSGPMTITAMFPFFKDTVFEDGIDAAFRATSSYEAYLFKGGQYALINYDSKVLIHIKYISKEFPSLVGTVFEFGIDAAFASHRQDEAYLFKGEYYALINFAPGTNDDYLIDGGVKRICDHWPSLRDILPRKNGGLNTVRAQVQAPLIHSVSHGPKVWKLLSLKEFEKPIGICLLQL